eukprot:937209-Prorocentrum_minimum.AAC.2
MPCTPKRLESTAHLNCNPNVGEQFVTLPKAASENRAGCRLVRDTMLWQWADVSERSFARTLSTDLKLCISSSAYKFDCVRGVRPNSRIVAALEMMVYLIVA